MMSFLAKIDAQMNYILSLIKQMPTSSKKKCLLILPENNKNTNAILPLSTSKNNNENKNVSNNSPLALEDNQSNLITSENFPFSHLCNRDVDNIHFLYIE
jgi:hypothetical protein